MPRRTLSPRTSTIMISTSSPIIIDSSLCLVKTNIFCLLGAYSSQIIIFFVNERLQLIDYSKRIVFVNPSAGSGLRITKALRYYSRAFLDVKQEKPHISSFLFRLGRFFLIVVLLLYMLGQYLFLHNRPRRAGYHLFSFLV